MMCNHTCLGYGNDSLIKQASVSHFSPHLEYIVNRTRTTSAEAVCIANSAHQSQKGASFSWIYYSRLAHNMEVGADSRELVCMNRSRYLNRYHSIGSV